MYISSIRIQNLKLLRDFQLDFGPPESPRMWTVLIGENGLCKTSILRAIAMTAVGYVRANQLADVPSLADRRNRGTHKVRMRIQSVFGQTTPGNSLKSELWLSNEDSTLLSSGTAAGTLFQEVGFEPVRAGHFVAGYGVQRKLPNNPLQFEMSDPPALVRLASLFEKGAVIGTNFSKILGQISAYEDALRKALIGVRGLLPNARNIRLPGQNWAQSYSDLIEGSVLTLEVGGKDIDMPAVWLSPGYQSIIALISDIVGHFFFAHNGPIELDQMKGLILVDELDLHLHPRWQMGLIPALRQLFPKLQFVVTTHSPLILAGAKREEIVVLTQDAEGNVVQRESREHPGLLTASGILSSYFDVDRTDAGNLGYLVHRYRTFMLNHARLDSEDQQEVEKIRRELAKAGIDPDHFED